MREVLLDMLHCYGLKEVFGPEHNPAIIEMFKEIGYDWIDTDETPWCGAALNYFCKRNGYERSGKIDARSWLKLTVKVINPQLGDIVVLWRKSPSSWEGHVGLYISSNENYIYVLGGNQENMIGINPYLKSRVLGYRQSKKLI